MNHTVLIIDDNDESRLLLADILNYHGFTVMEALDGAEGVAVAGASLPDLIIMDIQMPVLDGISALKLLRGDPRTAGISVIAVTSFAMSGDKEKILAAGFDDYIVKPINTREFPKYVKEVLARQIRGE